jgi:thiol:disulfide interchange protein/DsbC/DsbD-like thiol-disulfide interchange protein
MFRHYIKSFVILYTLFILAFIARAEEVSAPNIKVELISEFSALMPGKEQFIGLRMQPAKDWHVYWKYQGDTGTPPKLKFENTEGIEFANIAWPNPEKIQIGHLVNYGYSEEVLLLVPIKVSDKLENGKNVKIGAKAEWLVCQEECIPGSAHLEINLTVSATAEKSNWEYKFIDTKRNLPLELGALNVSFETLNDKEFIMKLSESPGFNPIKNDIIFFPDSAKQIENAAPQDLSIKDKALNLKLRKPASDPFPKKISGYLFSQNGWNESYPQAVYVNGDLMSGSLGAESTAPNITFVSALLFAFLGGLILNLMPCVFPILSIKILGFVNKSGGEQRRVFKHGLAFGAGVLLSFWILAGLLMSLQSAGLKLGWGFQLQSPLFLSFIIILLFLVALNFYGAIEFGGALQNFFGKTFAEGYSGSFLSGVLATVLATPCTAPFMGTAIAVSLASTKFTAFIIFTFLGIGMAMPYVILSATPALLRFIPKPGAWMEKFKQFLSFPIFATVIWLIGVYLKQAGQMQTIGLLFSLLLVFIAVWTVRNLGKSGKVVALLLFGFSIYIAVPAGPTGKDYDWVPYSNKAVSELVNSKKAVFVDFTAEWCLTCKLNKFVTLDTENVQQKFKEKGVTMVKADWTSVDPEISDAIKSYGRSGVPLNILFYGGGKKEPYIFPAVLTPGLVLEELNKINN